MLRTPLSRLGRAIFSGARPDLRIALGVWESEKRNTCVVLTLPTHEDGRAGGIAPRHVLVALPNHPSRHRRDGGLRRTETPAVCLRWRDSNRVFNARRGPESPHCAGGGRKATRVAPTSSPTVASV